MTTETITNDRTQKSADSERGLLLTMLVMVVLGVFGMYLISL